MAVEKPPVQGTITVESEVDFTAALDGWTVEEIEAFVEGDDDGEGREYLIADAHVIGVGHDDYSLKRADLTAYLAWRKATSPRSARGRR